MAAAIERAGFAWFLTGPDLPEYRDANRALRLRDDGRGPEAVAREVIAFFRSRDLPVVADVDAVAETQGIGTALRRLGIMPVIGDILLMRYPHGAPPSSDASVEVMLIPQAHFDVDSVRDWIDLAASEAEDEDAAAMWRAVAEHEARLPGI